ncbi:MAG TPA: IclR family transcriptional regulator [bacterium]|nr:IclR family transcriptional regulator [bacterium]
MPGTVDKALELLGLFSEREPALGLSEIARRACFDKATTRRLLLSLEHHGMVEQLADSRKYRLGAAPLRLARVREAAYPVVSIVRPVVERLSQETGETAHFSLAAGGELATISLWESARANRVSLEQGEALPLHATASGIVYLAFAPPMLREQALRRTLHVYTDSTPTEPAAIEALLHRARREGMARMDDAYETEVVGIAAPVCDATGHAQGAIAVATPGSRMLPAADIAIRAAVRRAAVDITRALGGVVDPAMLQGVA